MPEPPVWATRLLGRVAVDYGRTVLPRLAWRRSSRPLSAGRTRSLPGGVVRLHVTEGCGGDPAEARRDARGVFVHELAHWLTYPERDGHGPLFYETLYALNRRYRVVPMAYLRECEEAYKPREFDAYWPSRRRS